MPRAIRGIDLISGGAIALDGTPGRRWTVQA